MARGSAGRQRGSRSSIHQPETNHPAMALNGTEHDDEPVTRDRDLVGARSTLRKSDSGMVTAKPIVAHRVPMTIQPDHFVSHYKVVASTHGVASHCPTSHSRRRQRC